MFKLEFVTSLKQVVQVNSVYLKLYRSKLCELVGIVREWTEYSLISISEPEKKIVTRGKLYQFTLLNHPKSCLKQVFRVKSVYLKLDSSKLSEN